MKALHVGEELLDAKKQSNRSEAVQFRICAKEHEPNNIPAWGVNSEMCAIE